MTTLSNAETAGWIITCGTFFYNDMEGLTRSRWKATIYPHYPTDLLKTLSLDGTTWEVVELKMMPAGKWRGGNNVRS